MRAKTFPQITPTDPASPVWTVTSTQEPCHAQVVIGRWGGKEARTLLNWAVWMLLDNWHPVEAPDCWRLPADHEWLPATLPRVNPTLTVFIPAPKYWRKADLWPESPQAWLQRLSLYPHAGIVHVGTYGDAGQFIQVSL